jgi:hypothetical protein
MKYQIFQGITVKTIKCFSCEKTMKVIDIAEKKDVDVVRYECECGCGADRFLESVMVK